MCCFSGEVKAVSGTKIFARATRGNRQLIVYSMTFESVDAVAMILPIPVVQPASEQAVQFINMEECPNFFSDLEKGFPAPRRTKSIPTASAKETKSMPVLEVVAVGGYEASFVPTQEDFARLDERFRLPPEIWAELPLYANYGFAVFQLKPGRQKVHPMAFEFPRSNADRLFFPTVHIHDGTVAPKAWFDHALYAQPSGKENFISWQESRQPASDFMGSAAIKLGIIEPMPHCYRYEIRGMHNNEDNWV